jgi:hypothetical protein
LLCLIHKKRIIIIEVRRMRFRNLMTLSACEGFGRKWLGEMYLLLEPNVSNLQSGNAQNIIFMNRRM